MNPQSQEHSSALIDLRHVSIRYRTNRGTVSAVDDVSFQVPKGASVGLVGESGSGKSTLALALMRLLPANATVSGEILFDGENLVEKSEARLSKGWRWRKLAMVFQKSLSAMSPVHRIGQQMDDVLALHEPGLTATQRKERLRDVLGAVRLSDRVIDMYPFELSGGMMQRTMIALGLLCNPPFVIFDEATTALDVITQAQILNEIRRLKSEFDLTTMVISHDVGVINAVTDIVAVLYAGQLMEVAPRDQFFASPQHPYSRALIASVPKLQGSKGRLTGIPGSLPDLTNPPAGCRFAPRCPHATGACLSAVPPLVEVSPGHLVRCVDIPFKEAAG
ncbi:MAG TPA: ABC transporter ATP-binding protein [Thermomicrobiales bacterium]|nr:ABC transporter ATP-binding protein [Thermomicrobiales bacterium]